MNWPTWMHCGKIPQCYEALANQLANTCVIWYYNRDQEEFQRVQPPKLSTEHWPEHPIYIHMSCEEDHLCSKPEKVHGKWDSKNCKLIIIKCSIDAKYSILHEHWMSIMYNGRTLSAWWKRRRNINMLLNTFNCITMIKLKASTIE